jgi:hypothetical protein
MTWLPEFIDGSALSPFHSSQMVVAPFSAHEPADADDAAGDMTVAHGDNVVDYLLHHLVFDVGRHHAEGQGQQVGGGGVVAIKYAVGVEHVAGTG